MIYFAAPAFLRELQRTAARCSGPFSLAERIVAAT
jgi:hypothetical protein